MSAVEERRRYRSFFWPVILIGAGIFLLVEQVNPDAFAVSPWAVALRLWPLLLILAGVDMLFARGGFAGTLIGTALGLLLVGFVVLVAAQPDVLPGLNLQTPRLQSTTPGQIVVPRAGVEGAAITISGDDPRLEFGPLAGGSEHVFEADLTYRGDLDFSSLREGAIQRIGLSTAPSDAGITILTPDQWFNENAEVWAVRAAPDLPFDLRVGGDDPQIALDLGEMQARRLSVEVDDGTVTATLPPGLTDGSFTLDDGTLDLTLPGGPGIGVRVNVSMDDGTLNTGTALVLVNGDRANGVWETEAFAQTEQQLVLNVTADDATLTVR